MRPSKRSRKSKSGDHSSLVEGPRFVKVENIRRLYKGPEWTKYLGAHQSKLVQKANKLWYHEDAIVLPPGEGAQVLRRRVIQEHHDTPLAGHMGIARTLKDVKRNFHWDGMNKEISNYCKTCVSCQRNKASNVKPYGLLQPLPVPRMPWQTITMDFIVGLPQTIEGYDGILVFVDKLTKLVHLAPVSMAGLTSATLATVFLREIFRHHGIPEHIISDRDTRMVSDFWKEVLGRLGSYCKFSTAFHPQTDGQTERFNRSLEEVIRHFICPDMTNWADLLPMAEFAMNSHHHEGTKEVPFILNYGRQPARPIDLALGTASKEGRMLAEELHRAWRQARELLQEVNIKMKEREDPKKRDYMFMEGEKVWLSSKNWSWKFGTRKLCPKWLGPFEIKAACGPAAYRLRLPDQWIRVHPVFHVSLLKPFKEGTRYEAPTPTSMKDGVPCWELQEILSHRPRRSGGGQEYLVAWKGFGPEYYSYLSEAQLDQAQDLLREYWQKTNMNPEWGKVREVPRESS